MQEERPTKDLSSGLRAIAVGVRAGELLVSPNSYVKSTFSQIFKCCYLEGQMITVAEVVLDGVETSFFIRASALRTF